MSKEDVLRTIGRNFYVWFLTLSILIISLTMIILGIDDRLLSLRIGGTIALTPLAKPLWEIFKVKGEKQEHEYKLQMRSKHNDKLKIILEARNIKRKQIQDYKLEKIRLKHSK